MKSVIAFQGDRLIRALDTERPAFYAGFLGHNKFAGGVCVLDTANRPAAIVDVPPFDFIAGIGYQVQDVSLGVIGGEKSQA